MNKRCVCSGDETRWVDDERGGSYLKREENIKGNRKHIIREEEGKRYRMKGRGRRLCRSIVVTNKPIIRLRQEMT